jgi:hypothetical protein
MDIAPSPPSAALRLPPAAAGRRQSVFVAAALGWALPGLGQVYVGRPAKALVMLTAIGSLFYAGLALTGFTCVDPQAYSLEFTAHALLGAPTAAAYYLTRDVQLAELMPWFEAGRLYAAVAGLLNVVAICDAMGEVLDHNRGVRIREASRRAWVAEQRREFEERAAAIEAQLAARRAAEAQVPDEGGGDAPQEAARDSDAPEGDALEGEQP